MSRGPLWATSRAISPSGKPKIVEFVNEGERRNSYFLVGGKYTRRPPPPPLPSPWAIQIHLLAARRAANSKSSGSHNANLHSTRLRPRHRGRCRSSRFDLVIL
nr:unnamed protein product [Digitaria exilis]